MTREEFYDLVRKVYPDAKMNYMGDGEYEFGSSRDNSGVIRSVEDMYTHLNTMGSSLGTPLSSERMGQVLESALRGGFQNISDLSSFGFTPTESTNFNNFINWSNAENASNDMFSYMPLIGGAILGAGALGYGPLSGAMGGGASGSGAAAGLADAAWGVNPASAGEFSLAGGSAGGTGGGLYSGAGGVTGLTPGGAGVTGLTGTASAGSLLTPSMAVSMGLPASAAMGGSGLTAAQIMGGVGGASDAIQGGSALSRLLGLGQKGTDALSLAGTLGATGLGMYGANQQADAYENIANKYLDLGAPYRNLLQQSYQPGFSMANQPDFQNALDTSANSLARAVSAKSGNPYDNPGVMMEAQKYLAGSLALPALQTYRGQLGQFGGLGLDMSSGALNNQVKQQGGMWEALGSGYENIFNKQKNPMEDAMKGLLSGFKLNTGLSF